MVTSGGRLPSVGGSARVASANVCGRRGSLVAGAAAAVPLVAAASGAVASSAFWGTAVGRLQPTKLAPPSQSTTLAHFNHAAQPVPNRAMFSTLLQTERPFPLGR